MNSHLRTILLLDDADATGAPRECQFSGRYCFAVVGTFEGASVSLEMLGPDDTTWIAIEDASGPLEITDARLVTVELPAGTYRAAVTGGDPSGMFATLKRIID